MTENLAGRGEGLAELREHVQAIINRWSGEETDYRGRVILMQLRAALEAAAPPSTAHALNLEQLRWLEQLRDEARAIAKGRRDCEWANYRANMADEILAALATPSPQAPQEQCNAFSPTSARDTIVRAWVQCPECIEKGKGLCNSQTQK